MHAREEKAVAFILRVSDLEEYKNAWLIICNNAREYPDRIYRVSNSSNSDIYVSVNPEHVDNSREWLSQFGKIIDEDPNRYVVFIDVDCDYTKSFDEDYIDSEYVLGETD